MRIGAHVSTRGRGPIGAIDGARACGADAVQIFGSNPRAWAHPSIAEDRASEFRREWAASGLGPLFLHASYMVNVASPNPDFRRRAGDLTRATVAVAEAIGADGVVVHAGSAGGTTPRPDGVRAAAATLRSVASEAGATRVVIELTAGGAGSVASTFTEARELFDACDGDPRLALCGDTCHLFAAGYELDTSDGVAAAFDELRRCGLDDRLLLIHANDSAGARGSHQDRHAHIGEGAIGEAGFGAILAQPPARRAAIVCETPGRYEDRARDVAALRRLASHRAAARPPVSPAKT